MTIEVSPDLSPGSFVRLGNGDIMLQGKGTINSEITISAATGVGGFNDIGSADSDGSGNWTFIDEQADGFAKRFYRATLP